MTSIPILPISRNEELFVRKYGPEAKFRHKFHFDTGAIDTIKSVSIKVLSGFSLLYMPGLFTISFVAGIIYKNIGEEARKISDVISHQSIFRKGLITAGSLILLQYITGAAACIPPSLAALSLCYEIQEEKIKSGEVYPISRDEYLFKKNFGTYVETAQSEINRNSFLKMVTKITMVGVNILLMAVYPGYFFFGLAAGISGNDSSIASIDEVYDVIRNMSWKYKCLFLLTGWHAIPKCCAIFAAFQAAEIGNEMYHYAQDQRLRAGELGS